MDSALSWPPAPLAWGGLTVSGVEIPRARAFPSHLVLGCVLALAMVGCPHGEGPSTDTLPLLTSDDPDAEQDLQLAREAAEDARLAEAETRYEAFLVEHPADPLVPVAQLALGRIALTEGDLDRARGLFEQVATHEDEAVALRGRLYLGVTQHLAGEDGSALELLRPLMGETVDPEETTLLLRSIAESSERVDDHAGAIVALDAMLAAPVPDEDRRAARERLVPLIDEEASDQEVQALYPTLPRDGFAWPLIAARTLRALYASGDMEGVRTVASDMRESGVDLGDELLAMALRAERTGDADPRVIGAILPLSGRGREVGQLAMRGLMLAAGTPGEGPVGSETTQVVFRDSGGDPERAARAVEDLVSLHRVIAIVGPIDGAAAARAAARAEELGVPLIALTPAAGVTAAGTMVFRLFFTPEGEVHELGAAARARGARRFAVLHPDNGYGRAMRALFAAEVEAAGGQLVAEPSYPERATTFRDAITALREASVEALFVADGPRQVSLIAPALASAGLWNAPGGSADTPPRARFTLLLPSVAYGDQLLRTTGRYLQGAILSQPFHAPTAGPDAAAFVRSYEARFGAQPDMFAAYAYDALALVRGTVDGGAATRSQVADRLALSAGARTAGPSRGLSPERGPVHGTRLMVVRGTELEPLDR